MDNMKQFYMKNHIGHAKYVVNYYGGISKHNDGSAFFDIKIFKNKKKLKEFIDDLKNDGYTEQN